MRALHLCEENAAAQSNDVFLRIAEHDTIVRLDFEVFLQPRSLAWLESNGFWPDPTKS